jgi:ABC-type antimicrobial peptide transport system permease subunit
VIAWALYEGQQDSIGINELCLTVSPATVDIGNVLAAVVALLGGLLPSNQAARRAMAGALRAT